MKIVEDVSGEPNNLLNEDVDPRFFDEKEYVKTYEKNVVGLLSEIKKLKT